MNLMWFYFATLLALTIAPALADYALHVNATAGEFGVRYISIPDDCEPMRLEVWGANGAGVRNSSLGGRGARLVARGDLTALKVLRHLIVVVGLVLDFFFFFFLSTDLT